MEAVTFISFISVTCSEHWHISVPLSGHLLPPVSGLLMCLFPWHVAGSHWSFDHCCVSPCPQYHNIWVASRSHSYSIHRKDGKRNRKEENPDQDNPLLPPHQSKTTDQVWSCSLIFRHSHIDFKLSPHVLCKQLGAIICIEFLAYL